MLRSCLVAISSVQALPVHPTYRSCFKEFRPPIFLQIDILATFYRPRLNFGYLMPFALEKKENGLLVLFYSLFTPSKNVVRVHTNKTPLTGIRIWYRNVTSLSRCTTYPSSFNIRWTYPTSCTKREVFTSKRYPFSNACDDASIVKINLPCFDSNNPVPRMMERMSPMYPNTSPMAMPSNHVSLVPFIRSCCCC